MRPTFAREKSRLNRRDKAFYGLSVMLFLLTMLVYAYPSIQSVQLFYEDQKLREVKRTLINMQNKLRLEYEMLISQDEMETRAFSHGYVDPAPGQIIYVRKVN